MDSCFFNACLTQRDFIRRYEEDNTEEGRTTQLREIKKQVFYLRGEGGHGGRGLEITDGGIFSMT